MGMAYVKATLRKLGGDIFFHSDMDVGTTFYFTLPVKFSRDQENGHEQKL